MAAGTSQPHLQAPVFAPPKHLSNRPHPVQSNLVSKSKSSLLDIQDFPPLTIPISIGTSNLKIVEAVQPQDCCPVNVESKAPALPGSVPHTTYSAVLKGNQPAPSTQQQEDCGLEDVHLHPVSHFEGKTAVFFPIEDQSKLVDKFKFVLIGKFSHGRPSWTHIKSFFHELKLNGTYNISIFDSKHLYIECSKRIDYNRIWLRLQWRVAGFVMRILKWTPQFSPVIESPIVPLWIQMDGLPLYVFDEMPLWHIANAIGKPIKIDVRNLNGTMRNIARVCVELDLTKPIVDSFWVCFEDKNTGVVIEKICVNVAYDFIPSYCVDCAHVGHKKEQCKRQQSSCSVENLEQQKVQGKKELKETAAISIADTVPAAVVKDKETRTMQTWIPKASNKPAMLSHYVAVANHFAALTEFKSQDNELMQQAKEVDSLKFDSVSLDEPQMLKEMNLQAGQNGRYGEQDWRLVVRKKNNNKRDYAPTVLEANLEENQGPLLLENKAHDQLDSKKETGQKLLHITKENGKVSLLNDGTNIEVMELVNSQVNGWENDGATTPEQPDTEQHNMHADQAAQIDVEPDDIESAPRIITDQILQRTTFCSSKSEFVGDQMGSATHAIAECGAIEVQNEAMVLAQETSIVSTEFAAAECKATMVCAFAVGADSQAIVPVVDTTLETRIDDNNKAQEAIANTTDTPQTHQNYEAETEKSDTSSLQIRVFKGETSWVDQEQNKVDKVIPSPRVDGDSQEWQVVKKNYKSKGVITRSQAKISNNTWADKVEKEQIEELTDQKVQPKTKTQAYYIPKLSKKQIEKEMCKLGTRLNKMGLKHKLRGQLEAEFDALQEELSLLR